MELFILYLWLKLDAFRSFLAVAAIATGIVALIITIFTLDPVNDTGTKFPFMKGNRLMPLLSLFFIIANVALPDKTQTAYLVGAHYALKAAESPEVEKIISLLRKKANIILDTELEKYNIKKDDFKTDGVKK